MKPYHCNNKPRPTKDSTYIAQAGWHQYKSGNDPVKMPAYVEVKGSFGTTECQYDKSATDKGCFGCKHGKLSNE